MYYGSWTVDRSASRQLAKAAAYAPGDAACALARWQHYSAWNDVIAVMLKVWCQIENPPRQSMGINFEENPEKNHPYPIWNDGDFLKSVAPTVIYFRFRD